jgi:hypothetical protein
LLIRINDTSSNEYHQVISYLSEDEVGHTAEEEGEHFAPQVKCAMLPIRHERKTYLSGGAMMSGIASRWNGLNR